MRILLATVATMLAMPTHAQSVPPQVPQYRCNNPPIAAFQNQAFQMAAAFPLQQRAILAATYVNSAVESWTRNCQQTYSASMLQWQAEMQRWQLMNR